MGSVNTSRRLMVKCQKQFSCRNFVMNIQVLESWINFCESVRIPIKYTKGLHLVAVRGWEEKKCCHPPAPPPPPPRTTTPVIQPGSPFLLNTLFIRLISVQLLVWRSSYFLSEHRCLSPMWPIYIAPGFRWNLVFSSPESLHGLDYKPPSTQQQLAEQRQKVVNELISTEKAYLQDLQLCVKYFFHELKKSEVHVLSEKLQGIVYTFSLSI